METYRRLRRASGLLTRELMNLEIEDTDLVGRVLDVGGAELPSVISHIARDSFDPEFDPVGVAGCGGLAVEPDLAQPSVDHQISGDEKCGLSVF